MSGYVECGGCGYNSCRCYGDVGQNFVHTSQEEARRLWIERQTSTSDTSVPHGAVTAEVRKTNAIADVFAAILVALSIAISLLMVAIAVRALFR